MNMTRLPRKRVALAVAFLLLVTTPCFALLGVGDIVFDPTSYASLVSQVTTIEAQYNMLKNNIEHFSAKQQWQAVLQKLENVNVANLFGETAGMSIALSTNSPTASLTAWKASTVTVNTSANSYLAGHTLGSSRMSQLAMIETSDAVSPDCLTAVGQYRSARATNAPAAGSLVSSQFDGTSSTNSEVQQLNLLNAAEAHKLAEMQSQGTIQTCLAEQMTVGNMERRNAAAADLNTAVLVQQQRSTNDTSAANEGSTWTTYLP
jgi:hypothetical protein